MTKKCLSFLLLMVLIMTISSAYGSEISPYGFIVSEWTLRYDAIYTELLFELSHGMVSDLSSGGCPRNAQCGSKPFSKNENLAKRNHSGYFPFAVCCMDCDGNLLFFYCRHNVLNLLEVSGQKSRQRKMDFACRRNYLSADGCV